MSTVTFFLTKHFSQNMIFATDNHAILATDNHAISATDNHAVLIKWKVHQCWRQSEQHWRQ